MRKLVLLLVLFALACTPAPRAPAAAYRPAQDAPIRMLVHGDTRFLPEERSVAESAATSWDSLSRGRVKYYFQWDLSPERLTEIGLNPRMVRVDSLDPRVVAIDFRLKNGAKTLGYTTRGPTPGDIEVGMVMDRVGISWFYPVILHELGHVAGLDDLPSGPYVMSVTNPANRFAAEDESECRRVFACPP